MLCVAFVKLLIRWLGVLLLAFAGLITAAWTFRAVCTMDLSERVTK